MGFSESVARAGLAVPWAEPALAQAAQGDVQLYTLLKGLIARESAWNPGAFRAEPAINDASYGLMQVLLSTAKSATGNQNLTPSDLFIPDVNIDAGSRYLKGQLSRYGDARRAVSAYNCGSECLNRATTFWPSGNWPYVDDVLLYQNWYLNHLPTPSSEPVYADEYTFDDPMVQSVPPEDRWTPETIGLGVGVLLISAAAIVMMRK